MKKITFFNLSIYSLEIILMILFMCIQNVYTLRAANVYVSNRAVDEPVNIGGLTFLSRSYQSDSGCMYKIIMKKKGKAAAIAKNTDGTFVTDGKQLYYSQRGELVNRDGYQFQNTIYRYDVESGKCTKIITGINYTVCNCSGKYLYFGTNNEADGIDLYVLNTKTNKKRHMADVVGRVRISDKRVVTDTNTGAIGNDPIYTFKLNGFEKKKIADGMLLSVKDGKIFYCIWDEKTYDKCKVYQCTVTGMNKKELTGWITQMHIPAEYMEI